MKGGLQLYRNMSKGTGTISKYSGGISDGTKLGQEASFKWGRALDFRSDPSKLTILPQATKDSGSIVTDLVKWHERVGSLDYFYGNTGNLYKVSSGTWTNEHIAGSSQGNGLAYFGEDGGLYYAQNTTFGRLIDGTWFDNFLGAEGGVPTNTNSLDLESGSSQYAYSADTASLSVTGDLSLEAFIKPESLPASGSSMTLISKWNGSGNIRSYKMDIAGVSNFFGDGSDGALTISTDTTEAPIDSACSGTIATKALTATNTSFAAGQKIMIHQTRGTNAGVYQLTTIESYTAGTITTTDALSISYSSTGSSKAQVRVLKQYTNVTVNAGITYAPKRWDGTVGGILAFYANGTVTVNGTINAKDYDLSTTADYNLAYGFAGGDGNVGPEGADGPQGEGTEGAGQTQSNDSNGNGGGGGNGEYLSGASGGAGGGGGGNFTAGNNGEQNKLGTKLGGTGGLAVSFSDLSTFNFGGGGGQGGTGTYSGGPLYDYCEGGGGGGGVIIFGVTVTMGTNGLITANGRPGSGGAVNAGGGGGGAGGSVLIKAQTATLGTNKITAVGTGGDGTNQDNEGQNGGAGGNGGNGVIHLDYSTSYTGSTTTPVMTVAQDSSLGLSEGYTVRLAVSTNGTALETLSKSVDLTTGIWTRLGVTWDASASLATFYKNGVNIGTTTGTLTAISNNASEFFVGANKDDAGAAANFFDGLIDDVRVWNDVRTDTEMLSKNEFVLYGTESNLQAYWKFDSAATDTTANANTLTLSGSPSYSTDVPFSGVTSRADLDQSLDTSGQTDTLPTTISEAADQRQTFVPTRDPQKSIEVNINTVGTGDWTMTVHDALNREVAAVTVANAELHTGDYEFTFASVWRPVLQASYHFHLTSTVADGIVVTTTLNNMETTDFHTYYQFLVSDQYHPMTQMLNFLAIGNERYVAKWEGLTSSTYAPHKITLPSGYRVRCFAHWREYLAIGTWKGTNIYDYDSGRVFFWNGTSSTYDFYIDVPEGGINAMFGSKGYLYIWAGYSGDLLLYQGGDEAQKIKRLPNITTDKYVEVLPGAATMWRSLVHFGIAGNSDSTAIHRGTYTWGSLNRNYPASLGFDYPLSLGDTTSSSVKIGMVAASGQNLYVSWQNQNVYGVDKISVSNNPYTSATYESLISDLGYLPRKKLPLVARIDFEPLISGQSVSVKYKADRESSWNTETEDTVGATDCRMRIPANAKEVEIGFDLICTATTSPVITGVTLESEDNSGEINA